MKAVFKYVGDNKPSTLNPSDGSVFEATFELPDDGTPDSARQLRVRVVTHEDKPSDVILDIVLPKLRKEKRVGSFESMDNDRIADLLYPVAQCVTRTHIEPK